MCLHCCYVDEACYLNTHLSVVVAKLRARCTVPCILTLRAQSYGFKWPSGDKTYADISAISCRSRTTAKGLLWGQGTLGTLWAWWAYCIWLFRRYLADEELRRDVTDSVAWKREKELLLFLPHSGPVRLAFLPTSFVPSPPPSSWKAFPPPGKDTHSSLGHGVARGPPTVSWHRMGLWVLLCFNRVYSFTNVFSTAVLTWKNLLFGFFLFAHWCLIFA